VGVEHLPAELTVLLLEALQVENARARGWSWQQIAARLGVTKQAVHKKYAGRRFLFGR
jgi:transcriptional regulator